MAGARLGRLVAEGAPAAVLVLAYYLLVGLVAGWRCREVLTSSPTARAVFGPGRSK